MEAWFPAPIARAENRPPEPNTRFKPLSEEPKAALPRFRFKHMMTAAIASVVGFCIRRPWSVIALAIAWTAGAAIHTARHFAINSDVHAIISSDVPWAHRALDYLKLFPQTDILVVVTAPTPEIADQASAKLADALRRQPARFHAIREAAGGTFFAQNGLLFLPVEDVKRLAGGLTRGDPLLGTLASDPSLRGALDALSLVLAGVARGEAHLADLIRAINMAADAADAALAGRTPTFSWRVLMNNKPPRPHDLRRFLLIKPVLDFSAMQPGRAATDAIARTAAATVETEPGVRVRQTGPVPIADDEFATLTQHAGINAAVTLIVVATILWLALGSFRIIFAVAASILVGLVVSTAAGLLLVGALNVMSVAFFVLFVGLGVDFGIQFSVRYRAERHDDGDLHAALRRAARKAGVPLALAACATAVGFSSFMPTAYRGLADLGEIAGVGMIIAFIASITLLPALLAVLKPPGETHSVGFAFLAPFDRFLERHRVAVVGITLAVVVLASPLLLSLPFDFNPMHLRDPKVESVATYLELRGDPLAGGMEVDVLAPDLAQARATARQIAMVPQVAQTRTLADLVPADQDEKLKLIRNAAQAIDPSLNPEETQPPPTDQDNVAALRLTASDLLKVAGDAPGAAPDAARRLAGLLRRVADADPAGRTRLEAAIMSPLRLSLDQLRQQLKAQPISIDTMPAELVRDWMTPQGQARIQVLPKGDPNDTQALREFVDAVLAVAPTATGSAVELVEAANTVVRAFMQAGAFALAAIFVLLWITLRRVGDVLLTIVPLLVAGVVTLELCVVFHLPLNFANIIALPLLLGVGVAFKIYYVLAWRAGKVALLQSPLTRAVLFSGMTTATAFGSLWLSSHPGTSSMGKLMALALVCTMAAAVLFQPALMGPPRKRP
jgi:uncharacterized protein